MLSLKAEHAKNFIVYWSLIKRYLFVEAAPFKDQ
jgi:hypothetical protein